MKHLFVEHPGSVGETYLQHSRHAAGFGFWMAVGAAVCLVHAVLPFLFERTGSRIIERLYDRMLVNRARLTPSATHAGQGERVSA